MKKLFLVLISTVVFLATSDAALACECNKKSKSKKSKSCACETCGCKDKKAEDKSADAESK